VVDLIVVGVITGSTQESYMTSISYLEDVRILFFSRKEEGHILFIFSLLNCFLTDMNF